MALSARNQKLKISQMTVMAMVVSDRIKFVKAPTNHLCCAICTKLYTDPVINFACGHSFCRKCLILLLHQGVKFTCPVDSVTSAVDPKNLVVNRSLQDQINDLDVYCSFGLKWSEVANDFVQDADGCREMVKYNLLKRHEESCDFGWVDCLYGENKCGSHRRKYLSKHLSECSYLPCSNGGSGCRYRGSREEVALHQVSCTYNGRPTVTIDVRQFNEMIASQKKLEARLEEMTKRTETLESAKCSLEAQVESCLIKIEQLSQKQMNLEVTVKELTSSGGGVGGNEVFLLQRVPSLPNNSTARRSISASQEAISRNGLRNTLPLRATESTQMKCESWVMPFQFKCIGTLRSHKSGVCCVQTWRNKLYSCGADGVIKVWDLENLIQGCKMTISAHTERIQALAVGSHFLYSAGDDLAIKSYHLDSMVEHMTVKDAHEKGISAMLCTSDYLFTASYTVIKIWNCRSLELLHTITGLHHWVRALACGPSKDKVYSGSHGSIDMWSPKPEFNLVGKITHCYGSIHSMAVTSTYIIIGTYNHNVRVYNVATNEYLHDLMGHVGVINCIVTSVSGKFMFTGSSDSTVHVWSLERLLPIQSLQRHNDSVNTLIVNGDLLLTGSEDAEIKVFKHFRMQMGFVPS